MTDPRDVLLDRAQPERAFTTLGERLARCAEFFPDEEIPPRSSAVLRDLFG
jgi:hypothetical protein